MMFTVRQALSQSALTPLDAQVLLAHAIGKDRAWLVAHDDESLTPGESDRFFWLARRRRGGEPVAYLTGLREFWGLSLIVSPSVMIPRPETETLVERALARLPPDRASRVLDLGTGCGAIALALARERRKAEIIATDSSEAALRVARANARRLGVYNIEFVRAEWYDDPALAADKETFDLIVSNPPYIAASDPHLGYGDLRYEPLTALSPGGNGLSALATIVAGAPPRISPGGALIVEHGYDQAEAVNALFLAAGFGDVESTRDLAGIPRVIAGRR